MTLQTAGQALESLDCVGKTIAMQAIEIEQLKRARDLAVKRMQESTAYCIELREHLNKYEPGAAMRLNAISKEMKP